MNKQFDLALYTFIKISKLLLPTFPNYLIIYGILKFNFIRRYYLCLKKLIVPPDLFGIITHNRPLIDGNNSVIINNNHLKQVKSGDYVKLKISNGHRIVQVIEGNLKNNYAINSTTLEYNLHSSTKNYDFILFHVDTIKIATEVSLSLINCSTTINNFITDMLLKNYFKCPKLLYANDIVAICIKQHAPEYYYTNIKMNDVDYVYFMCNYIKYEAKEDYKNGYFCVFGETTVKQAVDIQNFIPVTNTLLANHIDKRRQIDILNCILDICPPGLNKYMNQLINGIQPFILGKCKSLKLKPTFLIQGPKGVGKKLLTAAVAKHFGINIFDLTASDFTSTTYAQVESKLNTAFLKAKLCAPCILAIYNFENLCKNNEGLYDSRIINYFKNEITNTFSNNKFPIILICVSNLKDLPNDLTRIFLECITIDNPNDKERHSMLEWILKRENLESNIDLSTVSNKLHGLVYEDLNTVIYYATKDKLLENSNETILNHNNFEVSTNIMQSTYSECLSVPNIPKVNWEDIGGLNNVKKEIIRTVNLPLKHPDILQSISLKRSGILLYGPPGTGKTLLAKAVATECGLNFMSVKGPELLNMYVGQSEQNIRDVFEKAREASPCIIFFDELDSLAPNRGISGDSGGVMDRVVSQLLSEMDGLNQSTIIFIIGATNRPDLVDPALLRPGRFDKLLYVGPCTDFESKLSVLKAQTRKFKLSDKVNLEKIVKHTPENCTGADYYGICSKAWMFAASRLVKKLEKNKPTNLDEISSDDVKITSKDFELALQDVKPSVSAEDMKYFKSLQQELG